MEWSGYICLTAFICLIGLYSCADALHCYACGDTGKDNKCEKYGTYVEAWDGKRPNVLRNCSGTGEQICYIETYKAAEGHTLSQIRDCNDLVNAQFSFTYADKKAIYTRLTNLGTNNETSCIWNTVSMVCLSKCDTDYCNGPLESEVNSAAVLVMSQIMLLFTFIIL